MQLLRKIRIGIVMMLGVQLLCTSWLFAQQKNKIKLENASAMKNLKIEGKDIIRCIGNVVFLYDETRMYCDSAYLNPAENAFDAFGSVVISKEKTKITGDKLHFEGKTSMGVLLGREVRMVDEDVTLVTDKLFFNSKTSYAYYLTGGVINSKDSKLTSTRGYYEKSSSNFSFAGSVEMTNPDGTLFTDSLQYNSKSETAYFFGATNIYNKENFAYCEKGWHNRKLEQSNLQQNAYILSAEQKLFGDNIFFDKPNGFARILGNAVVIDTTNKIYAYGDKANYWDQSKSAEITDNPYVMMIENSDTLFLKTDKLFVQTIKDAKCPSPDSTYRIVKALGAVKYFRTDVQGVCDSMIYNTLDSTLNMHINPVMWHETNQMSANLITVYSGNKSIKQIDFLESAFVASKEDSIHFNQLRGKNIYARFVEGKLYKMDVIGNGQSVYYGKENDTITMVNKVECTDISIYVKNNTVSRIVYKDKPNSGFYPIDLVDIEEITLKGFNWQESLRPTDKYSIIPHDLVLLPRERGDRRKLSYVLGLKPGDRIEREVE